jgi:uncharacterized protein
MSQENVEVIQKGFDAWNAGDMDAFRETIAREATMQLPEGWPEPGPFVGRDAIMRQLQRQRAALDADALERLSDYAHADDRVVVRFAWRGAGHGPEISMEVSGVYTIRDGTILAWEHFWDHTQALEAAGLAR